MTICISQRYNIRRQIGVHIAQTFSAKQPRATKHGAEETAGQNSVTTELL